MTGVEEKRVCLCMGGGWFQSAKSPSSIVGIHQITFKLENQEMTVEACYFKVRRKAAEESVRRIQSDGLWGVRMRRGEGKCWFSL